jgi:hypothetical protein
LIKPKQVPAAFLWAHAQEDLRWSLSLEQFDLRSNVKIGVICRLVKT